jgi:hypothetical protein
MVQGYILNWYEMNKSQLGRPCFYLYMLGKLAQNYIYIFFHKTIV